MKRIVFLFVVLAISATSFANGIFATGSGIVAIPSGRSNAAIAFDSVTDGGPCQQYVIFNADPVNYMRVKIAGTSNGGGLQVGTDAALIPPNTMVTFSVPANGIKMIFVWGEDISGNPIAITGSGFVQAKQ